MTASENTGKKLIALTFDDGPSYYTQGLLDGLKERGAKATFFIVGSRVNAYDETIRRAYAEGHEIAQHTYDHPALTTKTDDQIRWQVEYTDELLDECLGMDMDYLLRPPYGDQNSRVLSVIGCPAVIWSIDSCDWVSLNQYSVRDTIVNQAFDGAIVLVHDIHRTSIPGALMAIDTLQEWGYEFVTVSELYRRRGVTMEDGVKYYSCKPNGTDYGPLNAPEIRSHMVPGGCEVSMYADDGAEIYYSTDGSFPNKKYTSTLFISETTQFRAVAAFGLNRDRSSVTETTVEVKLLQTPSLRSSSGFFFLESLTEGMKIHLTTDGSAVSMNSPLYTDPIPWFTGTVRCFGTIDGGSSPVATHYVSESGNVFADISPECWYFAEMDRAVSLGLLKGQGDNVYAPEEKLTRAAFATLLYRVAEAKGLDCEASDQQAVFSDLRTDAWYTEAIIWASERGILLGYPDGTVRPEEEISREQMCVMLCRLLEQTGQAIPESEPDFTDAGKISSWAYGSVGSICTIGLMHGNGNGTFAPKATATRAEATAVLLRLYEYFS